VPDTVLDENQQVSGQYVQEILRRIDESIAAGTFEEKSAAAWQYAESARGLGATAKSDWVRFLEFARTLGINGFSIQGRIRAHRLLDQRPTTFKHFPLRALQESLYRPVATFMVFQPTSCRTTDSSRRSGSSSRRCLGI
jgi:hypothetical protein